MPLTYSIAEGIVFGMLSYVLLKLLTGKLKDNKYIQTYKCKSFIARSNKPVHLHIDGESMEPVNEITVTVEPKSLFILTPSNVK